MSISRPARNLNLRLLASLLRPTAAHIPLLRSTRQYSTTQPRPQDVAPPINLLRLRNRSISLLPPRFLMVGSTRPIRIPPPQSLQAPRHIRALTPRYLSRNSAT